MADHPSDDRHPGSSNGSIEGQKKKHRIPVLGTSVDDQSLGEGDQTLADTDQTLADDDQTSSDEDQESAESDQFAADRDQAASDSDLAHGVDPAAHERSRDIRERTTRQREQTAAVRLQTADQRDEGAHARDLAARTRDQSAAARDLSMAAHEGNPERKPGSRLGAGAEILLRAASRRKNAARNREQAAEYRRLAAEDRVAALNDREQAARDRTRAHADREALARQLALSETDTLTGARTRAAGLADLDHELARTERTAGQLVVAYIDVVGLKTLNDSEGHAAGDELLQRVVRLIQAHLRAYDLVIRIGGDEFLCAMTNMTMSDARQRFSQVAGELAATPDAGAIRTGFAELAADESAEQLIERADQELIAQHQRR